jgi:hypothetical protein
MTAKPPLRHEEVQRILGLLEPLSADRSIVLVGFRKCMRDMYFRAADLGMDIDPFEAVLVEHPALPAQFRERRYPQMREQLEDRRARDRRNRAHGG